MDDRIEELDHLTLSHDPQRTKMHLVDLYFVPAVVPYVVNNVLVRTYCQLYKFLNRKAISFYDTVREPPVCTTDKITSVWCREKGCLPTTYVELTNMGVRGNEANKRYCMNGKIN